MSEFARHALTTPEFQMSPEERLKFTLANPTATNAMSVRAATAITKARISATLAELAAMNMDNANAWLQRVAEVNPKTAFELYLQLLEFSAPKLKAVEHSVADPGEKPMNAYSLSELQQLAARSVVSSQ